jgi:hypothetical protein
MKIDSKKHSLVSVTNALVADPVSSDLARPGIRIFDNHRSITVDICLPGLGIKQVEVLGNRSYITSSTKALPASRERVIHVVLPK